MELKKRLKECTKRKRGGNVKFLMSCALIVAGVRMSLSPSSLICSATFGFKPQALSGSKDFLT